jgi:hypothetical protein
MTHPNVTPAAWTRSKYEAPIALARAVAVAVRDLHPTIFILRTRQAMIDSKSARRFSILGTLGSDQEYVPGEAVLKRGVASRPALAGQFAVQPRVTAVTRSLFVNNGRITCRASRPVATPGAMVARIPLDQRVVCGLLSLRLRVDLSAIRILAKRPCSIVALATRESWS